MTRVHLGRRLVLEAPRDLADGAGGFTPVWEQRATVWAQIAPAAPRETTLAERADMRLPVSITVRAVPWDDPGRPRAGQQFREGSRIYRIQAVSERDRRGLYLLCQTTLEEEGP